MLIAQIPITRFSRGIVEDVASLSDEQLLALSIEKPGMFEYLVVRHQRAFLARAQAVVGSRDAAEDVVQEAFVRMYRFASRFRAEAGNFRAWSLTILMNVARTHYRKNARERGHSVILDTEHYESLPDPVGASEGDVVFAREVVERALNQAPKDVARIIDLAFLKQLPYKQIAEMEKLSVPAIKTRVFRAKAVLRELMSKDMN